MSLVVSNQTALSRSTPRHFLELAESKDEMPPKIMKDHSQDMGPVNIDAVDGNHKSGKLTSLSDRQFISLFTGFSYIPGG